MRPRSHKEAKIGTRRILVFALIWRYVTKVIAPHPVLGEWDRKVKAYSRRHSHQGAITPECRRESHNTIDPTLALLRASEMIPAINTGTRWS